MNNDNRSSTNAPETANASTADADNDLDMLRDEDLENVSGGGNFQIAGGGTDGSCSAASRYVYRQTKDKLVVKCTGIHTYTD